MTRIRSRVPGRTLSSATEQPAQRAQRRQATLLAFLTAPDPVSVENYFRLLAHQEGLDEVFEPQQIA